MVGRRLTGVNSGSRLFTCVLLLYLVVALTLLAASGNPAMAQQVKKTT